MSTAVNGHAHPPSPTVILKLLNVPELGRITVRFLGEMKGTMTHWVPGRPKGRPEVCLEEDCDASLHRKKAIWKGYAPAEVWRDSENDWYPGVLEVTEAFGQLLKGRVLLGELWEVGRHKGEFKHAEVMGRFIQQDTPEPLDTSTWVDTVTFRLYHTRAIRWGANDPLPGRVTLSTRHSPPPPTNQAPPPEKPAEPTSPRLSMREMAKARGVILP